MIPFVLPYKHGALRLQPKCRRLNDQGYGRGGALKSHCFSSSELLGRGIPKYVQTYDFAVIFGFSTCTSNGLFVTLRQNPFFKSKFESGEATEGRVTSLYCVYYADRKQPGWRWAALKTALENDSCERRLLLDVGSRGFQHLPNDEEEMLNAGG